jgi:molybdopterin/thiamine biosynthesis adenylyltransferase
VIDGELLAAEYPYRGFDAGWRFQVPFENGLKRRIDVLVQEELPFRAPSISLVDRPVFLTWPHVESDGVLCLLGEASTIDPLQPRAVLTELLEDAFELIGASERGENLDHFKDEFLTYWSHATEKQGIPFYSLLGDSEQTRVIQCWAAKGAVYVGDSADAVLTWLGKRFGDMPIFSETAEGLLIWCPRVLLPAQYPRRTSDVLALAHQFGCDDKLMKLASRDPARIPVVLGFRTEHGRCFAAVTIYPRRDLNFYGHKQQVVGRGFRATNAPAGLKAIQYLSSSSTIQKSNVERVDHGWVHGRDMDVKQEKLKTTRIALFGCGSLGSFVAHQLAMAGVGDICLVDPEELKAANVGRHRLGMRHVGSRKALALAEDLQADFPHLSIRGFAMSWQEFRREHPEEWARYRLVLSLTGDWTGESLLNAVHLESREGRKIIYGWTEPHACAGHAVMIAQEGGCLACHFDGSGKFGQELSFWKGETRLREPACGALFQPYGAVELSGTVSLIANLALETTLGSRTKSTHKMWVPALQYARTTRETSTRSFFPWSGDDAAKMIHLNGASSRISQSDGYFAKPLSRVSPEAAQPA